MKDMVFSVVKKTVKAAGVLCLATGAIALVSSGAATKMVSEGVRYTADTVKKIMGDKPEKEAVVEEAEAQQAEENELPAAQKA